MVQLTGAQEAGPTAIHPHTPLQPHAGAVAGANHCTRVVRDGGHHEVGGRHPQGLGHVIGEAAGESVAAILELK